jgi:hypothetical protein
MNCRVRVVLPLPELPLISRITQANTGRRIGRAKTFGIYFRGC